MGSIFLITSSKAACRTQNPITRYNFIWGPHYTQKYLWMFHSNLRHLNPKMRKRRTVKFLISLTQK